MLVFIQAVRFLKSQGLSKEAILQTVTDLDQLSGYIELTESQQSFLMKILGNSNPARLNDLYELAIGAF